jgi:hypothetical protein
VGKEHDYERLGPSLPSPGRTKAAKSEGNRAGIVVLATITGAALIGCAGYINLMAGKKADLAIGTCFATRMGTIGVADRRVSSGDNPTYMVTFASGIHSEYRASELTQVPCPSDLGR